MTPPEPSGLTRCARPGKPWVIMALTALLGAWTAGTMAQADPDGNPWPAGGIDPLALQAGDATAEESPNPLGLRVELSQQWFERQSPQAMEVHDIAPATAIPAQQQRLVLDFRREWQAGSTTRVGLSNRAERLWSSTGPETRNALREAYVSHPWPGGWFTDAGRINWHNGVGSGFNPTDFLRDGAGIEQATRDPRTLRENRLGTVMLRQQWLDEAGSIQTALIPALPHGNDSPRAFGWWRTNSRDAMLLKVAPAVSQRTTFDAIAYWRQGDKPRWGANLTYLATDAWVLHAEIAYARRSTLPIALRPPSWQDSDDRYRGLDHALGATWASTSGPVWVFELQRDARRQSRAAFIRMAWDKPFELPDTRLSAFLRQDLEQARRWWEVDLAWNLHDRQRLSLLLGGSAGSFPIPAPAGSIRRYGLLVWQMDW